MTDLSDQVLVALIAGAAAIIGGAIGAIASPLGKDWVARREHERKTASEIEAAKQARAAAVEETKRAVLRTTLDEMSNAMKHYELEWRGRAHADEGASAMVRSLAVAWAQSRLIESDVVKEAVDAWKRAIDGAQPRYQAGQAPPGLDVVQMAYVNAAEAVSHAVAKI